jgi:hypothetical protein
MGGAPGDIVITAFSPVQTHHFAAVVAGTVAIGPSSFKLAGVLPASGELASPVVVGGGTVLPGEALTIHAQAFFFDGLQFLASAPAALVVVDRTTGPSDGCPSTTIHVDDDAPNDPAPGDSTTGDPLADGTLARPFDDLTEALAAVVPGTTTTILVEDGLYTGPGNTGVVLPLIALEIRSRNGAEKCVFTPDSGFVLSLTSDSVVSGLTFTGATAGAVTGLGGTL